MGDDRRFTIKYPPPRSLGERETYQDLSSWWSTVEVFYSRDSQFEIFLEDRTTWNSAQQHYGFAAEEDGLERTAATKARHLKNFLTLLSTHLPFPYMLVKLVKETTSLSSVKDTIFKAYGARTTHDSFLDFLVISRTPTETYLTFFERLVDHVRIHLAPAATAAGHIPAIAQADSINITMMDLIASIWLQRIDSRLPEIVQTEFNVQLRAGTRLYGLVETIAGQVDQLIARYESSSGDTVRRLGHTVREASLGPENDWEDTAVNKLDLQESDSHSGRGGGGWRGG